MFRLIFVSALLRLKIWVWDKLQTWSLSKYYEKCMHSVSMESDNSKSYVPVKIILNICIYEKKDN